MLPVDFETLECYRELQSDYIQNITRYNNFIQVAKYGSLENMKWLIKNNCEIDKLTIRIAIINHNFTIADFLISKGYPMEYVCYDADARKRRNQKLGVQNSHI